MLQAPSTEHCASRHHGPMAHSNERTAVSAHSLVGTWICTYASTEACLGCCHSTGEEGRTFPGGGGCSMNYSKKFSKSTEGDTSVER